MGAADGISGYGLDMGSASGYVSGVVDANGARSLLAFAVVSFVLTLGGVAAFTAMLAIWQFTADPVAVFAPGIVFVCAAFLAYVSLGLAHVWRAKRIGAVSTDSAAVTESLARKI